MDGKQAIELLKKLVLEDGYSPENAVNRLRQKEIIEKINSNKMCNSKQKQL